MFHTCEGECDWKTCSFPLLYSSLFFQERQKRRPMHRGKFADCNFLGRRAYFPRHWTPRSPSPSSSVPRAQFHVSRSPSVRQNEERTVRLATVCSGKKNDSSRMKKKRKVRGRTLCISNFCETISRMARHSSHIRSCRFKDSPASKLSLKTPLVF